MGSPNEKALPVITGRLSDALAALRSGKDAVLIDGRAVMTAPLISADIVTMTFPVFTELVEAALLPLSVSRNHACIGMIEECGEVIGPIKKFLYRRAPVDEAHVVVELSDLLFYIAMTNAMLAQRLPETIRLREPNWVFAHHVTNPHNSFLEARCLELYDVVSQHVNRVQKSAYTDLVQITMLSLLGVIDEWANAFGYRFHQVMDVQVNKLLRLYSKNMRPVLERHGLTNQYMGALDG